MSVDNILPSSDERKFNEREIRILSRSLKEASQGESARVVSVSAEGQGVNFKRVAQVLHEKGIDIASNFVVDPSSYTVKFKPQKQVSVNTSGLDKSPAQNPDLSDLFDMEVPGFSDFFEEIFGKSKTKK